MKYRKKLSRGASKHLFHKTAGATQSINLMTTPMRGGYRL